VSGPGFTAKVRVARTTVFRTPRPALWMIVAPFSGVASAAAWTVPRSCSSRDTRTARLSSRAATAPFTRVRATVSAACRSLTADEMEASDGTGEGNDGLLVIAWTTPVAYAMRSAACFQSEGLVGTMGIEFIRPQNLKEFRGICRSRTSLAVLDRNYC